MFNFQTAMTICIGAMIMGAILVGCSNNGPPTYKIWMDNCNVAGGTVIQGYKEFREHWFCVKTDSIEILEVSQIQGVK